MRAAHPSPPQPPIFGVPSSQAFSGAGNLAPPAEVKPKTKPKVKPATCKKGFVKKKGKCVVRHVRKKNSRSKKAKK